MRRKSSTAPVNLRKLLTQLSPIEEKLIRLRLGIDGSHKFTHDEIAMHLGKTLAEVREIELRAFRNLRRIASLHLLSTS